MSRPRWNTRDAQVYNLAALVGRCVVKGFLHLIEEGPSGRYGLRAKVSQKQLVRV